MKHIFDIKALTAFCLLLIAIILELRKGGNFLSSRVQCPAIRHDIVRPGKAIMFGRSQSCRERNQIPVAWMAAVRETETVEAHRQSRSWNGERATGPQRK